MRIIELKATHVMRLQAVNITPNPEDPLVVIGGANEQGKSAVLQAVLMALGGAGYIPEDPVRHGADGAEIVAKVANADGDGWIVERWIKPDRSTGLKVRAIGSKRAERAPQSLLDICDFPDPMAFIRLPEKDMAEHLRRISGVDFGPLDRRRAELEDERRITGREAKGWRARAQAAVVHDDAPPEPVSVQDLLAEAKRRRASNAEADELRSRVSNAEAAIRSSRMTIAALERQLADERKILEKHETRLAEFKAAARGLAYEDIEEVEAQIAGAEAANRKLADNERAGRLQTKAAAAERRYGELTNAIADVDAEKARLLAESSLKVKGLSFDGERVTFRGVPFDQASQAQKIKVAVALGVTQRPDIRVLVVRDGSLLDDQSMQTLAQIAEKYDAQVFVERVGDKDPGAIIIEDGTVRS